jgi:hypothetical protein
LLPYFQQQVFFEEGDDMPGSSDKNILGEINLNPIKELAYSINCFKLKIT